MFVVEDGTGIENANSYCDVDYFREYWKDRGKDYSNKSDEEIRGNLVRATQYIDRNYKYIGKPLTSTQALAFPRIYVTNTIQRGIPREIPMATCEATEILFNGGQLFTKVDDLITEKSEAVGVIKTTYKYQNASLIGAKYFQTIYSYLKKYIVYSSNVVRRY